MYKKIRELYEWIGVLQVVLCDIGLNMRNLYSGFVARKGSNKPAQLQKPLRILKFSMR